MTIKAITPDVDIFSEAVAVAVAYDLPANSTMLGLESQGVAPISLPVLHRSERSAIYKKVGSILDKLGVPGEQCILRSICEGAQELIPGTNLISEILRILLWFPEEGRREWEPKDQWRYLGARKAGLKDYNCPDLYPGCPFSLLRLVVSLRPEL